MMKTQELYQKAMRFAGEKHCEQKVPSTKANYLLHVSNVTMEVLLAYSYDKSFDLDLAMQIAILHDVLEDTITSFEELKNTFGLDVAFGVKALSKDETIESKEAQMQDSLARVNLLQKEVGLVKLADRITNLQEPPKHWDLDKIKKYREEAILIAEALKDKNEYLNARLIQKIEEYEKNIS